MATTKQSLSLRFVTKFLSNESLTHKATMNAFAAALDYGARLVVGFLVQPFLVSLLGDTLYGVWRTLCNLTGYISAASGRPSQALKFTTAHEQNSTDYEQKRRNVGSSIVVWMLFLPLLTTIGGVLVYLAPIIIKDLPPNLFGVVRIGAAILMADMTLTTLTVLPQAVLEGENMAYKRMGASALLVFLGGGLSVLALYLNTGLIGVCVAEIVTTAVTGIFFLWVVRSYVPWFGFARPTRKMVKDFFGLSGWFLIWRLVMQLMTSSDLLILGMFVSAGMVTTYSLTKYVPETLINFVAIVVLGSTPGLGGIIGSKDFPKASRLRGEIMLITWLITAVIGTTILLWNHSFLALWVGEQRYAGSLVNLLVLILVTQFVMIKNDANIIDLTLNVGRKTLLGTLSSILSIAISALLVGVFHMGMLGLVTGLLIGRMILTIAYPYQIGRFMGVSLASQIKSSIRPALVTTALFIGATMVDKTLLANEAFEVNWFSLALYAGVTACIVAVIAFFVGLNRDQQKRIFARGRTLISSASH